MPFFNPPLDGPALDAALAKRGITSSSAPAYSKVAASGSALTLTPSADRETWYDVTLNGPCAFTLSGGTAGQPQSIVLVLRQDATAGRVPTIATPVIWSQGGIPNLNTAAGFYDILEFTTVDGVTWDGAARGLRKQIPAAPGAPSITVTPGSKSNVITVFDGQANGSAITTRNLYRGTAQGSETLVGPITLTAGTYTDLNLTNGTKYFYRVSDVNAVGETVSAAGANGQPYGYVNVPNGDTTGVAVGAVPAGAAAGATAARSATTFADVRVQATLNAWGSNTLFSTSGKTVTAGYGLYVTTSGTVSLFTYSSGSKFPNGSSAIPGAVLGQPCWFRAVVNATGAAVTVGGATYAANTISYFYSLDPTGATWTALNVVASTAIDTTASGAPAIMDSGYTQGARLLKVLVTDASGNIQFNPDFTTLATGTTTVTDTAVNPNTFNIGSPAAVA